MRAGAGVREAPAGPAGVPEISVIMPVYNAGATLDVAVRSVLDQSLSQLEILLVDDASTDDSRARARALSALDPRLRVYCQEANRGQAAARNRALSLARGRWIAVVDADDEIGRDRLRDLVEAGERLQADFIADSVEFAELHGEGATTRLRTCGTADGRPRQLSLEAFVESDVPLNGRCSFGYLKPIMRRTFLERWQLRYDEDLRFAEDLNLYVRALLHGAHFVLDPRTRYVYNQTPRSVTRTGRALPRVADQALLNNQRLHALAAACGRVDLDDLFAEHRRRWATVLWFNHLKLALRQRRLGEVLQLTREVPSGLQGLFRFARDRSRQRALGTP